MELIAAETGETVPLGMSVQAVAGPYRGTWWRLDDVLERPTGHCVLVSRAHPVGRHRIIVPLHVFGLAIKQAVSRLRRLHGLMCRCLHKVDEGLVMGVLALLPLAFVDPEVRKHALHFLSLLMGGE